MPIERTNESEQANGLNLHRRTVLKGAAWAVPVVAAAVAVPMASASDEPSDNPTSSSVEIQSNIVVGQWAQATFKAIDASVRPAVPAVFPENSVITIEAPAGGTLTIDPADQIGILSVEGNGTGTLTIIPAPGVSEVSFYFTSDTAGWANGILTGDLNNSGAGLFVEAP